jgi:hypothetical protein
MSPKDWTLLVIASSEGGMLQASQLQKSLFLLGRHLSPAALGVQTFYDFVPDAYGPSCMAVYIDAEVLSREGKIHICQPSTLSYSEYLVTKPGVVMAEQLRDTLTRSMTTYLDEVVRWVTFLSFRALVSEIYRVYPDMKINAVFTE